jgi:hypothetical protein
MNVGKLLTMTDGFGKVRKIGFLNGETLRMWRKEADHLYRKLDAWCFDKDAFVKHQNVQVFIVESDDDKRYLALRETFNTHAEPIQWPGHGEQLALPREFWTEFKE